MIEELLPPSVVAVETFGDAEADEDALYPDALHPEERALVARAVPKRRREFTAVRVCARRCMEKLGLEPRPVPTGERGAPVWPEGIAGTMTHCDGYRAAALVRTADLASLGIDAEPHGPLPEGVFDTVALPTERDRHRELSAAHPEVHWDRLLFSAKESVYKAWFPLTRAWLDFSEADITLTPGPSAPGAAPGTSGGRVPPARGTFHARLLVPGPLVGGARLSGFEGRWLIGGGLVLTAVSVRHG
ncbi:4'-phosphopantetheinyl transferase superfamily protein [Streptomyces sp. J2-1]|uniref:4'-phosphopantetheinyl transferase family protein n=1 Tax=Streptomyces corallincola TaxID=2851888 RepID=UPI001C389335|nr:4'-phosphopantetheinyl transferase superfamily protein [Streptomyces corallincola]MBV2355363.1 4'-phosphopantetheinyl transferase superfamily protein [Streptomyces corallincola]